MLTDSDGAGSLIRGHLKSTLPKDKVINLYIPKIEGKEKRKKTASKEGTLGVEGMETDLLYNLFSDFADKHIFGGDSRNVGGITKTDFFQVGMTGSDGSGKRRNEMAEYFDLPSDMTPNALLGALNLLTDKNGFFSAAQSLWEK